MAHGRCLQLIGDGPHPSLKLLPARDTPGGNLNQTWVGRLWENRLDSLQVRGERSSFLNGLPQPRQRAGNLPASILSIALRHRLALNWLGLGAQVQLGHETGRGTRILLLSDLQTFDGFERCADAFQSAAQSRNLRLEPLHLLLEPAIL